MLIESFAAKVLAAMIVAILLMGGGFYLGHHVEYLSYEALVAKIKAENATAIGDAELHNKVLSEAAYQQQMQITNTYQEKLDALSKERDDALASAGGGVWVRTTGCSASPLPDPAAASVHSHETDYAKLQPKDARAFIDLAADADQCAVQLEAAQQIIIQDRVEINGGYGPQNP